MANQFQKNAAAFLSGDGPCYQAAEKGQLYTRADFFAVARGDEALARAIFERASGQTPEQVLESLWQESHAPLLQPLPFRALTDVTVLTDPGGRYYDSQSLDSVLLAGGSARARQLQQMLDGQHGCIVLRAGQPGILFCKAYRMEKADTATELAQGYGFLAIEFPEVDAFICLNSDTGQILLCVWLDPDKISDKRLKQFYEQIA